MKDDDDTATGELPLDPGAQLHAAVLALLEDIATYDPPVDSPLGRVLDSLADAIEQYERATFPMDPDTEHDDLAPSQESAP